MKYETDIIMHNFSVMRHNSERFGMEVFYEVRDGVEDTAPSWCNWIVPGTFTPEMADYLNQRDALGLVAE